MLDTPGTWRYQSAVLLGPCPNFSPTSQTAGRSKGGVPPLSGLSLDRCYTGRPPEENIEPPPSNEPRKSQARSSSSQLLMQASQQVSLLTPRPINPGKAGSVRAFAGVAQLVEHLFCKQVVSGSIPLASSNTELAAVSSPVLSVSFAENSEGCPSGQREQAVNLPAHAYVGSNPTPSTVVTKTCTARRSVPGMRLPLRGLRPSLRSAGVTQLVESQFSKLMVDGSSPFSRSNFLSASRLLRKAQKQTRPASCFSASHQTTLRTLQDTRPASLVAGEAEARTGAERTPVREHRTAAEAQPPAKLAGRANSRVYLSAHLAQLVEHVLGKDEVTSSSLVVGSTEVQP